MVDFQKVRQFFAWNLSVFFLLWAKEWELFSLKMDYGILIFVLYIIKLFLLITRGVHCAKRNTAASLLIHDMTDTFQKFQVYAICTSNRMIGNAINDKFDKWWSKENFILQVIWTVKI